MEYPEALRLALPTIQQICAESGTPGLAIGVFGRHGKILDCYHGFRDVDKHLNPDADTIFHLAGLTKGFTALAVACLVADGKVGWDDRIDKFLPGLRGKPNGEFTLRDLLSHRTGLCRSDALVVGSDNRLLLTKDEGTSVYAFLNASRPPRQEYIYNNFGYHAVGLVIEQVSSMTYANFLAERIFKPLKMDRTSADPPPGCDANVAKAYRPYYNTRLRQVPAPQISSDTVAFAAGSIRSCMRDLLTFYSASLRKFTGLQPVAVFEELNPIPDEARTISEATGPLPSSNALLEQSYCMGWERTQLPNRMTQLRFDSGPLVDYPEITATGNAPLILHHRGVNIGCSATVYMIPELESGIVVLGNALGHCDATDWAAQLISEAYMCGSIDPALQDYASDAAARGRSAMEHVQAMLDQDKKLNECSHDLEKYTGTFEHASHQFYIDVSVRTRGGKEELVMSLQGQADETYVLRPHSKDTFVFNESYDELVDRGQWCKPHWFYKIDFLEIYEGFYDLCWKIDDTEAMGHIFHKVN